MSFQDFCFIVTEKLSTEDEELLVKSTFRAFKGGRVTRSQRDFSKEAISFHEFRATMKKLPEFVGESDIREMFNAADLNRDGVLDMEEFGKMVKYSENATRTIDFCIFSGQTKWPQEHRCSGVFLKTL